MGQKLHRSNRSVFKRRSPIPRILLSVTAAAAGRGTRQAAATRREMAVSKASCSYPADSIT